MSATEQMTLDEFARRVRRVATAAGESPEAFWQAVEGEPEWQVLSQAADLVTSGVCRSILRRRVRRLRRAAGA